jgi:exonuclease III
MNNSRTHSNVTLHILYQNVRGLNTKIDTFFTNILSCQNDVILLTETWLNDNVLSSEIFNDQYRVFRSDRKTGRGGGVLSAFRQVLRVHEFTINCPVNNIDIVACKLHLGSDGVVLNVVTIYIQI